MSKRLKARSQEPSYESTAAFNGTAPGGSSWECGIGILKWDKRVKVWPKRRMLTGKLYRGRKKGMDGIANVWRRRPFLKFTTNDHWGVKRVRRKRIGIQWIGMKRDGKRRRR